MHYGEIKNCDIANGEGVRVTLFVSGCTHHCKGCFQPETWDFSYGEPFTQDVIDTILHSLEPAYVAGLTLLGGEPFEPANQPAVAELLRQLRARLLLRREQLREPEPLRRASGTHTRRRGCRLRRRWQGTEPRRRPQRTLQAACRKQWIRIRTPPCRFRR